MEVRGAFVVFYSSTPQLTARHQEELKATVPARLLDDVSASLRKEEKNIASLTSDLKQVRYTKMQSKLHELIAYSMSGNCQTSASTLRIRQGVCVAQQIGSEIHCRQ